MELPTLALSTASPQVPPLFLRQIKRLFLAILHFKAGASEPTSAATSAQNTSTGSTPSVPAMIPHPPMSPVLASLVKARDQKCTLADRAVALANAQNEISKLPISEQGAYIELVNASRQRLIVDTYLFDSGQVQNSIPAKTK